MARLLAVKANMDATIAAGIGNVDLIKAAKETYISHFDLTLPYLAKQSKMETNTMAMSKENIAEWKATLVALRKAKENK